MIIGTRVPGVPWGRPASERTVVIPRLLAAVDAAAPLAVVRAPAGFGKSTLLRVWHEVRGAGHGVLTVDDADPLDLPVPPAGRTVLAAVRSAFVAPDVEVPGATYVEGAELRMDLDDTLELWSGLGLTQRAERLRALHRAVGGWPLLIGAVGAALLAAPRDALDDELVVAVVREELEATIVPTLGDDELVVLRALVAPASLTARTAAVALGGVEPSALLETLVRRGLLDEVEGGEPAYAWPSAVRAAFRSLLDDGSLLEVDARLARWHLERREPGTALEHAVAAHDETLVREVVQRSWLPLITYENDTLVAAARATPTAWWDDDLLGGVRELALLAPGRVEAWRELVPSAPSPLDLDALDARTALDRGLVEVFRLRRARHVGEALAAVRRLEVRAREAWVSDLDEVEELLSATFLLSALVHELAGDVAGTIAPLRLAHEAAPGSVNHGSSRHAAAHLAMDLAVLGEYDEAERWLTEVGAAPSTRGWVGPRARIAAWVATALTATARGEQAEASVALRGLLTVRDPFEELWPFVLHARARHAVARDVRPAVVEQLLRDLAARPAWTLPDSELEQLLRADEAALQACVERSAPR